MAEQPTELSRVVTVIEADLGPHVLTTDFTSVRCSRNNLGILFVSESVPSTCNFIGFPTFPSIYSLTLFAPCLATCWSPTIERVYGQSAVALVAVFSVHNKKELHPIIRMQLKL